jgi:hypothetical protein
MSTTHIRTAFHMEVQRNKVCGADVHKRFLVATILSRDGTKETQQFRMNPDELSQFRTWVIENGCEQVAVESTGIYLDIDVKCHRGRRRSDPGQCLQNQEYIKAQD